MKFEFSVDWGYRHIYFNKKFLPTLCFDGGITVQNGKLLDVKHLVFQEDRFGCHVLTPVAEAYGNDSWQSTVCNSYDGFTFFIEGDENTVVEIKTASATGKFTLKQLLDNKHLTFDLENPFLLAVMHVYMQKDQWYIAKQREDEIRLYGAQFSGKQNIFFGVNGVVVPSGERVQSVFDFSVEREEEQELQVKGAIRVIQSKSADRDEPIDGIVDFEVFINGQSVYRNTKFSSKWDHQSQHFEETFFPIPVALLCDGENTVEIVNHDKEITVLTQMVRFFVEKRTHLQILSCPKWLVKDQVFSVRIYALYPTKLSISCSDGVFVCEPSGKREIDIRANDFLYYGENEYFLKAIKAGERAEIAFTDVVRGVKSVAVITEVWDGPKEEIEPLTGIEIKVDAPEMYSYYLRKMLDEQMGNYVMFRGYKNWRVAADKIYDIVAQCKKHGVYTDLITNGVSRPWLAQLVYDASGEYNFAVGDHERTGIFYWGEYFDNPAVTTMDQAEKLCVEKFRDDYQSLKVGDAKVAMGDCSSGARYSYKAGMDILRHETYCANHLTMLPDARGSARAYNKPIWGAHIASQHNIQAELETAIGRYWLAMYLPWVFGANFAFEEDSLFQNNKYYRMVHDDYMMVEKQKVTVEFNKHIKTHARLGQPQVDIAFIQGRHEAPFTALSTCNGNLPRKYHNEDRRIWGRNGSPEEEWGHRQPEKGYHLLEVVSPNIYLPPLNQDAYQTRKVFASNPHGEWDFLPIEAPQDVYAQYKILFMLGWNTMAQKCDGVNDTLKNDYARLKSYVEQGGVIVLSVPQLSQRVDRKLFKDWENADLYNGGDVSDLFGVRIGKPCEEMSNGIESVAFPKKDYTAPQDLIRLPSKTEDEDGDCRLADIQLAGAEVCLVDTATNRPLLVRKKVGQGYAYLLCTYAYPGHEKLKYIAVNSMQTLLDLHAKKNIFVRDNHKQTYWSNWQNGDNGKLYLLNIDWTKQGNTKCVEVVKDDLTFTCTLRERKLLEIAYQKRSAVYAEQPQVYVVALGENVYELYGFGTCDLHILSSKKIRIFMNDEDIGTTINMDTIINVSLNGKAILRLQK